MRGGCYTNSKVALSRRRGLLHHSVISHLLLLCVECFRSHVLSLLCLSRSVRCQTLHILCISVSNTTKRTNIASL